MSLGDNIRYLRLQHNYSQDYLSEVLGYKSYTTIQKWESGVSEPPVKKLKELANIFKVDMDDLANKDFTNPSYPKSETFDMVVYIDGKPLTIIESKDHVLFEVYNSPYRKQLITYAEKLKELNNLDILDEQK